MMFRLVRGISIVFALAALGGCPPEQPTPPTGELSPRIADVPSLVNLGELVTLDAGGTTGGEFNVTWRVEEPEGCDRSAPANPVAVETTFEVLCGGVHNVRLEVSPPAGGDLVIAEASFEGIIPPGFLSIAVENVTSAALGGTAQIELDFDLAQIPASLIDAASPVVVEITLDTGATLLPEATVDGATVSVPMLEAHASLIVDIHLSIADGTLTSPNPVSVSLTTLNSPPDVDSISYDPFDASAEVTITAVPTDLDGDIVTCSLAFAEGNTAQEFALPPADTSGACTFTFTPPALLEAWLLRVLAEDEFGAVDDDENEFVLTPDNPPPVVSIDLPDRVEVDYTCAANCASDTVSLTVTASDNLDDAADLVYDVVDLSNPPLDGALELTPGGAPGEFTLRIVRGDVGALAGDYRLGARVTEVTTAPGIPPSTTIEEFTLAVRNAAPSVVVADDTVPHLFDTAYRATLSAVVIADDANNNHSTTIEVITCPNGAAPQANVCGDLTLDESSKQGEVSDFFAVSSSIGDLIGDFVFEVTVTDADGASVVDQFTISVGNETPIVVATGGSIQQQFIGNNTHQAIFLAFSDPDGDPLDMSSVNVDCDGACVATIRTETDGRVIAESAPLAAFLTSHTITGTATDGLLISPSIVVDYDVENTAPVLQVDLAASAITRAHATVTGIVSTDKNGAGERLFLLVANFVDANGDPLTVVVDTPAASLDALEPATYAPGAQTVRYDLTMTYAAFQAAFNGAGFDTTFRLSDAFGFVGSPATASPDFSNRSPSASITARFTDDVGTGTDRMRMRRTFTSFGFPPTVTVTLFDPTHVDSVLVGPGVRDEVIGFRVGSLCGGAGCAHTLPITVTNNFSDEDGDPLEVSYSLNCPNITGIDLSPTAFALALATRSLSPSLGATSCNATETLLSVAGRNLFTATNATVSCEVTATVRDVDTDIGARVLANTNSVTQSSYASVTDPCP